VRRAFWLLAGAAASAAIAIVACSASPKLAGMGETCLQATDCADGLVCIPQKGGSRVCSNDLSSIQTTEEAGGGGDDTGDDGTAAGDGPTDAAPPSDGPEPQDGASDTTSPPDTGPPPDAGD
jgi:hypothetical protein